MNALKKHIYKLITKNNKKAQNSDQVMLKAHISDIYNEYIKSSRTLNITAFETAITLLPMPKKAIKSKYAIISVARKEIVKLINYKKRLSKLNSLTRERVAQSAYNLGIKRGTTEQNIEQLIQHHLNKTKAHTIKSYNPF
jgi:hypothetical protein